ncbi:hypothetical protein GCM10012275_18370 [Longimycelium tulufanense]|uniref:2'-5' RNA ligase family protein n=1 Tax=Longimycelium tulufanense TaxID=907463 RepID=A0A8J3CC92_9PSEU|nr:2'-5' RNA ligase family protein [Longimycelium tulufanense]GGM47644.1 hypothetical protein GCM10012275_18370 [Longimycelium tulufanense]
MSSDPGGPVDTLRSHWWWRPGWRYGRRCYTWLLTFARRPELHRLVSRYQGAMFALEGFDLVPLEWLHLPLQDVGFTDEVTPDQATRVADAVTPRLAEVGPLTLTFHELRLTSEALVLPARPLGALEPVRTAIREAVAEVLGADRVPAATEPVPQVSVAYANAPANAVFARAMLSGVDAPQVEVPVTAASLVVLGRDHHMYEWQNLASAPLRTSV